MSTEPAALTNLLASWNERDPAKVPGHLAKAIAADVEFVDPNYAVKGFAAFHKMVLDFRVRYPKAKCVRKSAIDVHHDRARYHWRVVIDENAFVDGMDCVQFDASGLLKRVDGFFGILKIEGAE